MKNFPIVDKETGKEHWISRSVAVVVVFIAYDGNLGHILAVQRGKGTPDPEYVGSWCLPCGYLDYGETCVQAASRELLEETGIEVNIKHLHLLGINDNPQDDKRENVVFKYIHVSTTPLSILKKLISTKYSEKDEISSIEFIPMTRIRDYKWAFCHDKLILKEIFKS